MESKSLLLLASDFHNLSEVIQKDVYDHYYNLVYGIIIYMVRDHSAVEDIIQESFIKIVKKAPSVNDEAKMIAWLKTVTKNTTYNYLRKHKKRLQTLDVDSLFVKELMAASQAESIENEVEVRMLEEYVETYLGQIKPEYRVLIEYRWREGLSYKEIADQMDTTEDIIRQKLYRVRQTIKKRLLNDWGVSE